MHIYIYMYTYIQIYTYTNIYIYIERERGRRGEDLYGLWSQVLREKKALSLLGFAGACEASGESKWTFGPKIPNPGNPGAPNSPK